MGYLRNNSMFAFGKADRAKTSATMREILDSMWLFNDVFARALAKFGEIKTQQKSEQTIIMMVHVPKVVKAFAIGLSHSRTTFSP
jgi:hypothetical protein